MTDFDKGLARRKVNFAALTPLDFIARAAEVYGDKAAVVYGSVRRNWRQTDARARQLASALQALGIGNSFLGLGKSDASCQRELCHGGKHLAL